MPKKLDQKDFRAGRWVLLPYDYAIESTRPTMPLRDLIDQDTWETIIQLPDDVTIQTTNVYGSKIRLAEAIRADWVSITLDIYGAVEENGSSPFNETVTNSFSELQASLFNAISGYYRTGISTLRNVLEHLTIGLDYELKHSRTQFDDWMNGNENKNIKFGISASGIASKSNKQVSDLEKRLIATVGDNIFRQEDKLKGDAGGFSRRHFADLSKYTHGAPGKTEADLWQSNGPIYRPDVFEEWCSLYGKTMALAALLLRLALPANGLHAEQIKMCYDNSRQLVPKDVDGAVLLEALSLDPVWT
jgi:hypothetical protein